MAHGSEPRFLVLHGLKLKGFAETAALAGASGLAAEEIERHLADLAAAGFALRRDGRVSGWQLTPAGRAIHAEEVAAEIERSGARADVEHAHSRFLDLNGEVLDVCTAWQVRDLGGRQVPNDHRDGAYDRGVVGRLAAVHGRARPVTDDLGARLARFGRYGERLDGAVARVEAGDHSWFTTPVVDSYHTVWFELHEDLLTSLGLERAHEARVG